MISETASTADDADDYGYEEEIKEFLKLAEESKVNLEAWKKAALHARSNKELLREEMQVTIAEVTEFVNQIEEQAKMRKFRRRTYGSGEWAKLVSKEKHFNDAIQIGGDVMKKLLDALTVIPEPIIEEPLHSLTNIHGKIASEQDPTKKLALEGYELILRFAKVLEGEGIPHNYPIPKPPEKVRVFRKVIADESSEVQEKPIVRKSHQVRSADSKHTSVMGSVIEDVTRSAGSFLHGYADRNHLEIIYKEISAVKTVWQQEYIYTCKMGKLVGEGKAKRRSTAKQIAAAYVLRQILNRSMKYLRLEDMPPLTKAEMKDALALTCEYIEYGDELQAVCSQENSRPPIYTPLINKVPSSAAPRVEMRCKALGFNAVGFGRDKDVAKRMAAKLVLDQLIEERERRVSLSSAGQATKQLDWIM